jgi:mannose-1-phosphate guanylyltransferase
LKPGDGEVLEVSSFREKPDAEKAKEFVETGHFFWNAGMFFWRTSVVLELLQQHLPETAALLAELPKFGGKKFSAKLAGIYPLCENVSIDYGVIEKAEKVAGLALDDIGWNDVGSWEAVYDLATKDASGNASKGELFSEDSRGNYVDAGKTVALVGVENLIIVDTPDALLVGQRSRAQDVSKLVKAIEAKGKETLL